MYILAISCYFHDAAAVLLKDGKIIAAIEEERLSRHKHDAGFPSRAIDFVLEQTGIKPQNLDYVVFYEKPFRKLQRIFYSTIVNYPKSAAAFAEAMRVWLTQKLWIKQEIATHLGIATQKILFTQHHLAHAASCFYPSPFVEAAILTVDGVGEWTTTSTGIGIGNHIELTKEIRFPQSLGLLYSAFTAWLGFEVNEGEWKVMGLAPYGRPRYVNKIWKMVKLNPDGSFFLDLDYFAFQYSDTQSFSDKFVSLFGKPIERNQAHLISEKGADVAASIQVVTEEILLNMAKKLQQETQSKNLCLAGGVALNSVANYRLLKESGFSHIFVQPAAGDSGAALGAALYVYHQVTRDKSRFLQSHSYLGIEFANPEIKRFLRTQAIDYHFFPTPKLLDYIAGQIARGRVVGWMQGKCEWGPRALGARSILADARNPKMKDIINSKVKFREAFRPFAPSVLAEKAHLVFDLPQNTRDWWPLRYMLYVVPVRTTWRKKVPAITHIDHTARPQLVDRKINPLYHKLIRKFYQKTGVPLVLNTSFNLKGEPIVATPTDAYSTFLRSGIDILVMGNYVCEKERNK